ncbi:MAG: type IV pilus twitching motility protein PilT [Candidatus Hydrogenedentota bacterium]
MSTDRDEFLKLLQRAIQKDASDIHLKTGSPPYYRIDGYVTPQEHPPLREEDIETFVKILLNDEQLKFFLKRGEIDLAFTEKGVGRFRVNVFRQRGLISLVMRRIKSKMLTMEQLHLPHAMERLADLKRGLVLITGTTGSGKSTTLASLIDLINEKHKCHIVTIEDPIEFIHADKKAVVNQREVTIDTQDFSTALRAVMRQDPDVILIGEMRDVETFQAALGAAETGHLVLSTLHTTNVMLTIDRIIDLFPSNQHSQVRSQLAQNLQAIMCMRLVPRADGSGRVPAVELLFATPTARMVIRDNRIAQLPTVIQQGREDGAQSFNDSLHSLVKARLVTVEQAMLVSENPEELNMLLQGIRLSSQKGGILK